ncbi:hypothetical protein B0I37DRAFT_353297 [Chaetomium sp. MPI-CAGE-AT-0009]|nr:hypothetical protein B0I37DRAFT_353297 [Chaetomium sp. MPI-CAGE-AT-0009]
MGLTTILRGFRVPIALLDRFLEANGQHATYGHPPLSTEGELDTESTFLLTKLAGAGRDTKARLFIPQREGQARAALYVVVADERVFRWSWPCAREPIGTKDLDYWCAGHLPKVAGSLPI